jgi:hypothetical protein
VCPSATQTNSPNKWGTADMTWIWTGAGTPYEGSYIFNGWFYGTDDPFEGTDPAQKFLKETDVQKPSQTPVFADANWVDFWPKNTDPPATDLYDGTQGSDTGEMIGRITLARHGGAPPGNAPRNVPAGQTLPGAINLGIFDGHVETAKLENLWNYYWNNGWVVPVPRPP